jgi:hypothetical protein
VSETSAPARVVSEMLCSSSTQTSSMRVCAAVAQTALTMSVMFALAGTGRPRKRAKSAASIRGVAAGGTVT